MTNDVNGIFFLTPSTGFVAFSNYVGFTQDSGKTYIHRPISYTNVDFNGFLPVGLTYGFTPHGVLAFSTDSLLVYGDFSFEPSILFSKDQGLTWKMVYHVPLNVNAPLSEGFTDLRMIGNTGFAVHHEGILKTIDRGQTWFPVVNTPLGNLHKISYPVSGTVYASGGPKIYRSNNDGVTWTDIASHPNGGNEKFNNIYFTSANTGYCTEAVQFLIYRTVDGGANWVRMNAPDVDPRTVNDIVFTNDSTGYIAASLYLVDKTTDYGKTWETCKKTPEYQYLSYSMLSLFFLSPQQGWAGAQGDYLLMTTDGGSATWPKAYFKTDTTGITATGLVHLNNYSRKSYQYSWYKNDTQIGTSYDLVYAHNMFQSRDTIKLIVNNGSDIDSNIQYIDFNPPVILSSFSPAFGTTGSLITITGINLDGTNFVSIGGVPAAIQRVSSTQVQVIITGNGASGAIITGYRVTATSHSGCKASDSLLVTVKPTPEKPVISENASYELVSSTALSNQWYTDAHVLLTGANGQQYKPANQGWFTVQTDADGCFSEFASLFHYLIPVVTPTDTTISIHVSPNPTPDNVIVIFTLKDIPTLDYILCDQSGRVLLTATNLSSGDRIPLNGLPVGIYIIHFLHEGNNMQTFQVIKR